MKAICTAGLLILASPALAEIPPEIEVLGGYRVPYQPVPYRAPLIKNSTVAVPGQLKTEWEEFWEVGPYGWVEPTYGYDIITSIRVRHVHRTYARIVWRNLRPNKGR